LPPDSVDGSLFEDADVAVQHHRWAVQDVEVVCGVLFSGMDIALITGRPRGLAIATVLRRLGRRASAMPARQPPVARVGEFGWPPG